jgi:kynurenine formamidase
MKMSEAQIDEIGNGITQGYATIARAVAEMSRGRKLRPFYDLSHEYSDRMPFSPFSSPISVAYKPTSYIAAHAGNGEVVSGQIGSQGTKIDALGHFGYINEEGVTTYYGGLTQDEVKPTDASPLLHLGIEQVPPIMTSAILLDARKLKARSMTAGEQVTASDIDAMIASQQVRDLMPGDALFIHTGWEEKWSDYNVDPTRTEYYSSGPGLSLDAAKYIATKDIVCVGMDVPFIDAVNEGFLRGDSGAPVDMPTELPFFCHHHNLTQAGIYQIHNMHLGELATDRVYLSGTFVLPLRIRGGSNSAVRPVAIGGPYQPTDCESRA